jgi:hypothetical protein
MHASDLKKLEQWASWFITFQAPRSPQFGLPQHRNAGFGPDTQPALLHLQALLVLQLVLRLLRLVLQVVLKLVLKLDTAPQGTSLQVWTQIANFLLRTHALTTCLLRS